MVCLGPAVHCTYEGGPWEHDSQTCKKIEIGQKTHTKRTQIWAAHIYSLDTSRGLLPCQPMCDPEGCATVMGVVKGGGGGGHPLG